MNKNICIYAVFFAALTCFSLPIGVNAAETVRFHGVEDLSLGLSSKTFLQSFATQEIGHDLKHFLVAKIDLNDDGLDEFIIKNQSCSDQQSCNHLILAETAQKIVQIGDINARTIRLSDKLVNGVYALEVYNDNLNDYRARSYTWEPETKRYIASDNASGKQLGDKE